MLKRLILIAAILSCATIVWGDVDEFIGVATVDEYVGISTVDEVVGQTVAGGESECPDGTYLLYWDGDHSSGEMYACVNGGDSTKNGTNDGTDRIGATGESGSQGFTKSAADQWVKWENDSDDIIDDAVGTFWARVYTASTGGDVIAGGYYDSNEYFYFEARDDNRVRITWYDSVGGDNQSSSSGDPFVDNTWTWVGHTWNTSTGIQCGQVDDGSSSWSCSGDEVDVMNGDIGYFGLGEDNWGPGADSASVIVTKIYVYGSYQASHP